MQRTLETTVSIMVVSINILTAPECSARCTTSLLDFPRDSSRRRSTRPSDEGWRKISSSADCPHGNQLHNYSQDCMMSSLSLRLAPPQ